MLAFGSIMCIDRFFNHCVLSRPFLKWDFEWHEFLKGSRD